MVFMHIVLPTPGGIALYLAPNILGWIFISLLIASGFWQVIHNKKIIYSNVQLLLLVGVLLLFIPFFYDNLISYFALPRLLAIVAGLLLLFSLTQLRLNDQNKVVLLLLLLLGISIEAIIGLIQLFILTPFDFQLTGYTPLFGRPYGSFTQPNVMASFLASGIALSLFLLLPHNAKLYTEKLKLVIYPCLFFCVLLIITLQSKTGYLGAIIVILSLTPIFIKYPNIFRKSILIIIFGIISGIISMQMLQETNRGKSLYSDMHRADIYKVASKMFIEKPFLGYGYGGFEKSYLEFHLEEMKTDKKLTAPMQKLKHPHNEILFWAVEGGIVTIVALLIFSYAYLSLFKGYSYTTALPIFALVIPILLHTQTEFPFYHSIVHWVYFIILIWLTEHSLTKQKLRTIAINHTVLLKIIAITLPIITSVFMLTSIHTALKMEQFKISNNKDVNSVNSIINTLVWQDYFEVTLYNHKLQNGFKQKDPKALLEYIQWGNQFAQHTPSKELYTNMTLALKTLELNHVPIDDQLKETIYKDTVRLYPYLDN
jgi:O-antigen polymerase